MLGSTNRALAGMQGELCELRREIDEVRNAVRITERLLGIHEHDEETKRAVMPNRTLGQEMGYEA